MISFLVQKRGWLMGDKKYQNAISGKKIPILTLDNKWHRLFTQVETTNEIKELADELNVLLKKQGNANTQIKDIKKLKAKLMDEIVNLVDENDSPENQKKVEENKRLIAECNEKVDAYQDDILDLPKEIDEVNRRLMIKTMEICYEDIHDSTDELEEISEWIEEIRKELKKKVIRKQEKQKRIQDLYSYMHDIFGAEVIELFDMKYNPENNMLHAANDGEVQ